MGKHGTFLTGLVKLNGGHHCQAGVSKWFVLEWNWEHEEAEFGIFKRNKSQCMVEFYIFI